MVTLVGKALNDGTNKATRIDELARTIIDLCGQDREPEYRPERPGDTKDSYAGIKLAKQVLGYEPTVSLNDGLKEMIKSKLLF